jgi:hypothetical protein
MFPYRCDLFVMNSELVNIDADELIRDLTHLIATFSLQSHQDSENLG